MKIKLLIITLLSAILLSSCAVQRANDTDVDVSNAHTNADTEVLKKEDALLSYTDDKGMSYIDSFIFIGESTTYHMKSRGVLSGGTDTKQIWAPRSGTMNLDLTVDTVKIVYPETGEELTFLEAAKRKKPKYILLTFGLNGAVQKIKKGEEYYKRCYKKLTDSILSASPDTKLILQSAFPVAENMDMSAYSIDLDTLNSYINTINSWSYSFASENGFSYLDTSEILKDDKGRLDMKYQSGDGYHLNAEAYRKILFFIRTHGYEQ